MLGNWRGGSYHFPASSNLQGCPLLPTSKHSSPKPLWPNADVWQLFSRPYDNIDILPQASFQLNCSPRSTPSYHLARLPALWPNCSPIRGQPILPPSFKLHPLASHASPKRMAWAIELHILWMALLIWESFDPKRHLCNTRNASGRTQHCTVSTGLLLSLCDIFQNQIALWPFYC